MRSIAVGCLVVLNALIGPGCSESEGDGAGGAGGDAGDRSAGTGGTGDLPGGAGGKGGGGPGDPGVAGKGGDGGPVICGALECAPGEHCNGKDECECEVGSCELGLICDPASLRCLRAYAGPREFGECDTEGEILEDLGLECLRASSGGTAWFRICTSTQDCGLGSTICVGTPEDSYCATNGCGSKFGGEAPNGEFFEECDAATGLYSPKSSTELGVCYPRKYVGATAGICLIGGSAGWGETCRQDSSRKDLGRVCKRGLVCQADEYENTGCGDDRNCQPGQICNPDFGRCEMAPCGADADCGPGDALYCNWQGICELSGYCEEVCSAGSNAGGTFASCEIGTCPSSEGYENLTEYCEHPCNPFGGFPSCSPVGGKQRVCVADPTSREPTRGECRPAAPELVAVGGDCSAQATTRGELCPTGSTCVVKAGQAICAPLCYCDKGFPTYGWACDGDSGQCAWDEACVRQEGLTLTEGRIGVCGKQD